MRGYIQSSLIFCMTVFLCSIKVLGSEPTTEEWRKMFHVWRCPDYSCLHQILYVTFLEGVIFAEQRSFFGLPQKHGSKTCSKELRYRNGMRERQHWWELRWRWLHQECSQKGRLPCMAMNWRGEIVLCAKGKKELSVLPQVRCAIMEEWLCSRSFLYVLPDLWALLWQTTWRPSAPTAFPAWWRFFPLCLPGQRLNTEFAKHDIHFTKICRNASSNLLHLLHEAHLGTWARSQSQKYKKNPPIVISQSTSWLNPYIANSWPEHEINRLRTPQKNFSPGNQSKIGTQ